MYNCLCMAEYSADHCQLRWVIKLTDMKSLPESCLLYAELTERFVPSPNRNRMKSGKFKSTDQDCISVSYSIMSEPHKMCRENVSIFYPQMNEKSSIVTSSMVWMIHSQIWDLNETDQTSSPVRLTEWLNESVIVVNWSLKGKDLTFSDSSSCSSNKLPVETPWAMLKWPHCKMEQTDLNMYRGYNPM